MGTGCVGWLGRCPFAVAALESTGRRQLGTRAYGLRVGLDRSVINGPSLALNGFGPVAPRFGLGGVSGCLRR